MTDDHEEHCEAHHSHRLESRGSTVLGLEDCLASPRDHRLLDDHDVLRVTPCQRHRPEAQRHRLPSVGGAALLADVDAGVPLRAHPPRIHVSPAPGGYTQARRLQLAALRHSGVRLVHGGVESEHRLRGVSRPGFRLWNRWRLVLRVYAPHRLFFPQAPAGNGLWHSGRYRRSGNVDHPVCWPSAYGFQFIRDDVGGPTTGFKRLHLRA